MEEKNKKCTWKHTWNSMVKGEKCKSKKRKCRRPGSSAPHIQISKAPRPKRGRFSQALGACMHAGQRESAGKAYGSAGKDAANAMKVTDKSAGNFQRSRTHEDLHDLHP